jgi:hypothetical protein
MDPTAADLVDFFEGKAREKCVYGGHSYRPLHAKALTIRARLGQVLSLPATLTYVLVAPPESGKTLAAVGFVTGSKASALMMTGAKNDACDYHAYMAANFGVGDDEPKWIQGLITALTPRTDSDSESTPVLILDDLNEQQDINAYFVQTRHPIAINGDRSWSQATAYCVYCCHRFTPPSSPSHRTDSAV